MSDLQFARAPTDRRQKFAILRFSLGAIGSLLRLPPDIEVDAVREENGMTELVVRLKGDGLPVEAVPEGGFIRTLTATYDRDGNLHEWFG